MKNLLISIIAKVVPRNVKFRINQPYISQLAQSNIYYSQNGEDVLLQRLFNKFKKGFYVDVGAHNPIRFSNTLKLYQRGWRGLNIDAWPESKTEFDKLRSEDINLSYGISTQNDLLNFYVFNEPALNTFSEEEANKKNELSNYFIKEIVQIQTFTLAEILERHMPTDKRIDYLNIDVEGLDYDVLRSNDWNKFSPSVISIESQHTLNSLEENPIYTYLKRLDYSLVSILYNTLVFANREYSESCPFCL